MLVYIGSPHSSSEVHRKVIDDLGPSASEDPRLCDLRALAVSAKNALYAGDFGALAQAMNRNTEVQRRLHKDLVCAAFDEIISVGRHYGAIGFKVNGAGGDGGSMTLLTDGDNSSKRKLLKDLSDRGLHCMEVYLARHGLRVW